MRLDIRSQDFDINQPVRGAIERRLRFALGRFGAHVRSATVYLTDQNGSPGGKSKHCRIVVHLRGSVPLGIEDSDTDLRAVVYRAAHRIEHSVRRELERRRDNGSPVATKSG